MNQSAHSALALLLAPLQSSFTEAGRVSTRFIYSQISSKLQTVVEPSNRFIASDKPIKNYIPEYQN